MNTVGIGRFFINNARLSKVPANSFFLRNTFVKKTQPKFAFLQSSFFPTRPRFATHRDLGFSSGGGGSKWNFKRNWYIYKNPLIFTFGALTVNAILWKYAYQVPGLSTIKRNPELAVYAIMGINVAVFGGWQLASRGIFAKYFTRYGLLHKDSNFRNVQMITSAFSHMGFFHLAANMFVLYQFGPIVAKQIGAERFTEIYLDGALIGSLGSIMAPLVTGSRFLAPSLGASAAVFTTFGLCTYLLPHLRVQLFFIPIPVGGWEAFMGSLVVNFAGMYFKWGAIDYAGHVGGSLVAIAWGQYYQWLRDQIRKRRSSIF